MMDKFYKMKRLNFTMIELLAVVCIFFIIFSLLQPSLSKIYSNARAMQCMGNQARVGAYMNAYVDDHAGLYAPATKTETGHWNDQITYDDSLSLYDGRNMEDRKTVRFYTPEAAVGGEETYRCTEEQLTGWRGQLRRSYALNTRITHRWVGPVNYNNSFIEQTKSSGDVPGPSQVILLTEVRAEDHQYAPHQNVMSGGQNGYYAFVDGTGGQSAGLYALYPNTWANPWHEGEWNYTFADGHVEKLTPMETLSSAQLIDRNGDGYWTPDLSD